MLRRLASSTGHVPHVLASVTDFTLWRSPLLNAMKSSHTEWSVHALHKSNSSLCPLTISGPHSSPHIYEHDIGL
jgi:hypothetical protein